MPASCARLPTNDGARDDARELVLGGLEECREGAGCTVVLTDEVGDELQYAVVGCLVADIEMHDVGDLGFSGDGEVGGSDTRGSATGGDTCTGQRVPQLEE